MFSALHRALGVPPGPLTDQMLDDAIAVGLNESDDLDWKASPPPASGLANTDFPKDVAAFANAGGGLIVYGVTESGGVAGGRVDVNLPVTFEQYERTLRTATINAITPPVFGVEFYMLGELPGPRALVVEVPASNDGPHLIYNNQWFGAPFRSGSDTEWMKERRIEQMYRARFDERRHANEAIDALYDQALAGHDTNDRAWLVGVAHPRVPRLGVRLDRDGAREIFTAAKDRAERLTRDHDVPAFDAADILNPRSGLRRWLAPGLLEGANLWRDAWLSVHDDGSAVIALAVGGARVRGDRYLPGSVVLAVRVEQAVACLMGILQATSEAAGTTEYTVRVGIELDGAKLHMVQTHDDTRASIPVTKFIPVEASVNAGLPEKAFLSQTREIANDCVNQGGVESLIRLRQVIGD
jgi:hypothetical protein